MRLICLVVLALLTGCASQMPQQPGPDSDPIQLIRFSYSNFHELVRSNATEQVKDRPEALRISYAQCWADAMVARIQADELERLDRFARGEISVRRAELNRVEADAYKYAGTTDKWEFMRPYCPGVVAQLR